MHGTPVMYEVKTILDATWFQSLTMDDAAPRKHWSFEIAMPYVCELQICANSSAKNLHHRFAKMRAL
jgi:hypothetical protein